MRLRGWGLAGPWIWLGTVWVAMGSEQAYSQQEPAVLAGVQYLKHHYAGLPPGESAMIALGLLKAEVPHGDPAVEACVARFRSCFTSGSYEPQRSNGTGIYEAAAAAMALANLDPLAHRSELTLIANYILSQQRPNGSWDYTGATSAIPPSRSMRSSDSGRRRLRASKCLPRSGSAPHRGI